MNKKIIILIVMLTFATGIVFTVRNIDKSKETKSEEIEQETNFKDENGDKYTVKYSENNLVYEIYDENGTLVAISPTESGVKEYIESLNLTQTTK